MNSKWNRSEIEVNSKWNRSEVEVKSKWSPSETEVTSKWNRSDIEVKSKWHRSDIEVKPKWNRSELEMKSKWNLSETEVTSKWSHSETEVKSKWSRSETEVKSKWHRSEIEVKPKWNRTEIKVKSKLIRSDTEVKPNRKRSTSEWSRSEIEVTSKRGPPSPQSSYPTLVGLIGINISNCLRPTRHPALYWFNKSAGLLLVDMADGSRRTWHSLVSSEYQPDTSRGGIRRVNQCSDCILCISMTNHLYEFYHCCVCGRGLKWDGVNVQRLHIATRIARYQDGHHIKGIKLRSSWMRQFLYLTCCKFRTCDTTAANTVEAHQICLRMYCLKTTW